MLVLIKRDLYHLIHKYKKYFPLYLLVFIINLVWLKWQGFNINFNSYIGLDFSSNAIWYLSFYLLINSCLFYVISYLYNKENDNNLEFILTRVSKLKWLISKIISTIVITVLIYSILTILFILISFIFKLTINNFINSVSYYLILSISISLTFLFFNTCLKKHSLLCSLAFLLTIYYTKLNLSLINLLLYIIIITAITILNFRFLKGEKI